MKLENNTSDLAYLGRRIDKALSHIKKYEPELESEFIQAVNNTFSRILSESLNQEEEDYLFEILDEILDYLENSFDTVFQQ